MEQEFDEQEDESEEQEDEEDEEDEEETGLWQAFICAVQGLHDPLLIRYSARYDKKSRYRGA